VFGVPSPPVKVTNEWNVLLASIVRAIRDQPPSVCTSGYLVGTKG
jgi:hypothetical protein